MIETDEHNQRVARLTFKSVYPHYLTKIQKKGRSAEDLHKIIEWLTGFGDDQLQELMAENASFEVFFQAARLNPQAHLIKGVICGYRIEDIANDLTRQMRYLDKLVDELAKGRPLDKILRRA